MRLNSSKAAMAFKAIARTFGEVVRIEPLIEAEYTEPKADPNRPVMEITAVVALTPVTDSFDGSRHGNKINTGSRLSQRSATIWITPSAYASLGYALLVGDAVKLIGRQCDEHYLVARDPVISDRGDISVYLTTDGNQ